VEEWLKLLAGPKYELLCQWLVVAQDPTRECMALVMRTGPNSGKNLLAGGLARLWSESPPPRLNGLKTEQLEKCPLVFCDERLPGSWYKQFGSMLREFLSLDMREGKILYHDPYEVVGYARLIVAGNSTSMFSGGSEDVQDADARAIAERVLMIDSPASNSRAKAYLKAMAQPEVAALVTSDTIAKHALWLQENHKPPPGVQATRFGVVDADTRFARTFSVNNEARSRVYDWVHSFIVDRAHTYPAVVCGRDDKLYVRSTMMAAKWKEYDHDSRVLRPRQISNAVKAVSSGRARLSLVGRDGTERPDWYRVLDMDVLDTWVEMADVDVDVLIEGMTALAQRYQFRIVTVERGEDETDETVEGVQNNVAGMKGVVQ
jgi:hypothetical protein